MTRCEACHGPIGAHENPHWFGGAGGHVLDLPRVGEADRG